MYYLLVFTLAYFIMKQLREISSKLFSLSFIFINNKILFNFNKNK